MQFANATHAIQFFLESKYSITSYILPDPDIFTFDSFPGLPRRCGRTSSAFFDWNFYLFRPFPPGILVREFHWKLVLAQFCALFYRHLTVCENPQAEQLPGFWLRGCLERNQHELRAGEGLRVYRRFEVHLRVVDVARPVSTVNFPYTYKCGLCMTKLGLGPSLA